MTVSQLIERLKEFDPNLEVWNSDCVHGYAVTGMEVMPLHNIFLTADDQLLENKKVLVIGEDPLVIEEEDQ